MSTPIERIAGYACEVNEEQWRELVKVADEVKLGVWNESRSEGAVNGCCFAQLDTTDKDLCLFHGKEENQIITYPNFLAKLKGVEKWEPKNGEEVEVKPTNHNWQKANYIGMDGDYYVCFTKYDDVVYHGFKATRIRPLRQTITRKEAEEKLNARIID